MAKDTGPSKVVHHNPEATDSDKRKALDEAMSRMEKNFGKGAVMRLGDKTHMEVDTTPTGYTAPVTVSLIKTSGGNADFTGSSAAAGSNQLVWFYDHDIEIQRDNVVTVLMVSYAD